MPLRGANVASTTADDRHHPEFLGKPASGAAKASRCRSITRCEKAETALIRALDVGRTQWAKKSDTEDSLPAGLYGSSSSSCQTRRRVRADDIAADAQRA